MSLPIAAQCVLLKYGTALLSFAIVLECERQRGTRRRRFVGISISSLLRSDIKREPPPMSLSLVTKRCRLTGNCRFRCHRTPGRAGHEYARTGRLAAPSALLLPCGEKNNLMGALTAKDATEGHRTSIGINGGGCLRGRIRDPDD